MQQIIDIIFENWPYVLYATVYAIFSLSVVVYQTKDKIIKKRQVKGSIEKSKNFRKYHITEVDVNTLNEKNKF